MTLKVKSYELDKDKKYLIIFSEEVEQANVVAIVDQLRLEGITVLGMPVTKLDSVEIVESE